MYNEVEITEEDFIKMSPKDLLVIFNKNRNITILRKNKDVFSLTYTTGLPFGIKYAEILHLRHQEYVANYKCGKDDDPIFHTVFEKILSPLNFEFGVNKLITLYRNTIEGKKTKIRDLTEEEIDNIVWKLNEPID